MVLAKSGEQVRQTVPTLQARRLVGRLKGHRCWAAVRHAEDAVPKDGLFQGPRLLAPGSFKASRSVEAPLRQGPVTAALQHG